MQIIRWDRATALCAILALSLGIGVGAGVFGFLRSLITPPLRGEQARNVHRLVRVPALKTYAAYRDLRDRLRTLDIGVYYRGQTAGMGRGSSALPLRLECSSHTYFHLYDVRPTIGRMFEASDDVEGAVPLLLLGHDFWMRQFAGDAAIIGTIVEVNARPYTVIGVAAPDFGGVEAVGADAWTLLSPSPMQCLGLDDWLQTVNLQVVGRIREPFTLVQAADEISLHQSALVELNGPYFPSGAGASILPLYDSRWRMRSSEWQVFVWVVTAAVVVMLLVCANVSVLLLLGVLRRRDEMAVRLQLGARPRQVAARVFAEVLTLGVLSMIPATVAAAWIRIVMEAVVPVDSVGGLPGLRELGTVAILSLGVSALSGVLPAVAAGRSRVNVTQGAGVVGLTGGRTLVRDVLLAGQIAISLVLVMVAWLFVRSAGAATRDVGYDLEHVVVVSMDIDRTRLGAARVRSMFDLLEARVLRVPAVESAALSSSSPLGFERAHAVLEGPSGSWADATATNVSPSYFETVGTQLVRGRPFESSDLASGRPVMIVSDGLADRLWPDEDALLSCAFVGFADDRACADVVGVSESRRASAVTWSADDEIFLPLRASELLPRILLVRTRVTAREAVDSVRAAVQGASPDLPFVDVRPLSDLADEETRAVRLGATMGSLVGVLATALAGIGVYGALASAMRQRKAELGIRMALGAGSARITWLLARRGLAILVGGWIMGGVAVTIVTPVVAAELFGVVPLDAASFLWASGMIVFSVAIGIGVSTGRVFRLDPFRALGG